MPTSDPAADSAAAGAPVLPDDSTLTALLQGYLEAVRAELCASSGEPRPEVDPDLKAFFARYSNKLSPEIVYHFLIGAGLLQELRGGSWRVGPQVAVQLTAVQRVLAEGKLPTGGLPVTVEEGSEFGEDLDEITRLRRENAQLRRVIKVLDQANRDLIMVALDEE